MSTVGGHLADIRIQHGLSLRDACKLLRLTPVELGRIERNLVPVSEAFVRDTREAYGHACLEKELETLEASNASVAKAASKLQAAVDAILNRGRKP